MARYPTEEDIVVGTTAFNINPRERFMLRMSGGNCG